MRGRLAEAVMAMRRGPSLAARTQMRAPWARRFADYAGATFHVVIDEACWLRPTTTRRRCSSEPQTDRALLDAWFSSFAGVPSAPPETIASQRMRIALKARREMDGATPVTR